MTNLYSCRHSGDQYRITKFDDSLNVESSYLCTPAECECPAGVQPTCRHRKMLPKFLERSAVGTDWMLDYERNGWVQMTIGEPAAEVDLRIAEPTPNLAEPANGEPSWRRGL